MPENKSLDIETALQKMSEKELGKIKVFVIEDDPMIRDIVNTKLTAQGCIPYSTGDGGEAISLAREYKPDAIILDLMLPNMSGEQILVIIKQDVELKEIPVVVFSNKSDPDDIKNVMDLGAKRYFIKAQSDVNELISELKSLALKN
jgi:DNA-binding response OmpR family regulator